MSRSCLLWALGFLMLSAYSAGPAGACSTFLLERGDTLLVGHNLDEYIPMPGLLVVNPRGTAKHGLAWGGFINPLIPARPGLAWTSRYGSITYSAYGREFPDGGLNEAGLYVGEMTYWFTEYPKGKDLIRLYHNQWVQYLLDNFSSVGQVLAELKRVVPDGHCRWQFFVADSSGVAAAITFVKGQAVVNTGGTLPVKVLCNRRYAREMDTLRLYRGFGGDRAVDFSDTTDDRRFVRAAKLLRDQDRQKPAAEYAFEVLRRLDWGNNRWSLVFDLRGLRVWFNTDQDRQVRSLELGSCDLSAPPLVLDINRGFEGDVAKRFAPHNESLQHEYVSKMWDGIDAGFFGNLVFKPLMKSRMVSSVRKFAPAKQQQ